MIFRFSAALHCSLALLLLTVGCSGRYGTTPIQGVVKHQGENLQGGGNIRFIPIGDDGNAVPGTKAAHGTIEPDGTFKSVTTYEPGDGVTYGKLRVEIIQNPVIEQAQYEYERGDQGETQKLVSPEVRVPPDKLIDPVYRSSSSPLTITVDGSQSEVTIEVPDAPPAN